VKVGEGMIMAYQQLGLGQLEAVVLLQPLASQSIHGVLFLHLDGTHKLN